MSRFLTHTLFAGLASVTVLLAAHPVLSQSFSLDLGEGPSSTGRIIQLFILITVLSLAPSILVMVTSFTRIVVVLSFLRTAMGTQQTPPNQVLVGIALFLTLFIMNPILQAIYDDALMPVQNDEITFQEGLDRARIPLQQFMLGQTREKDMVLFMEMSETPAVDDVADVPLTVLVPAFITSELKTAFTIGFLIYIPFIIIDFS